MLDYQQFLSTSMYHKQFTFKRIGLTHFEAQSDYAGILICIYYLFALKIYSSLFNFFVLLCKKHLY